VQAAVKTFFFIVHVNGDIQLCCLEIKTGYQKIMALLKNKPDCWHCSAVGFFI
jgi:hypothetical protein